MCQLSFFSHVYFQSIAEASKRSTLSSVVNQTGARPKHPGYKLGGPSQAIGISSN